MKPELTKELIAVAEAVADAARPATLAAFRSPSLAVESKTDGFDPVTEADRNAENAMRAVLAELRPDDGIVGEEFGSGEGTSGLRWILDPIDGTRGFVSGTPTWGVLIALADADGPKIGIIDQPYIGERFVGAPGRAEMVGPRGAAPLRVSCVRELSKATIFTTFPEVGTASEAAAFHDVAGRCRLTRYGMDCYAYALLAAGCVDLVIEAGLQAYDIAAPIAVVEAAGGVVTDWEGGPAHGGGRAVAASTRELHAAALGVIGSALRVAAPQDG